MQGVKTCLVGDRVASTRPLQSASPPAAGPLWWVIAIFRGSITKRECRVGVQGKNHENQNSNQHQWATRGRGRIHPQRMSEGRITFFASGSTTAVGASTFFCPGLVTLPDISEICCATSRVTQKRTVDFHPTSRIFLYRTIEHLDSRGA
jgi:hypothetical protein